MPPGHQTFFVTQSRDVANSVEIPPDVKIAEVSDDRVHAKPPIAGGFFLFGDAGHSGVGHACQKLSLFFGDIGEFYAEAHSLQDVCDLAGE